MDDRALSFAGITEIARQAWKSGMREVAGCKPVQVYDNRRHEPP